MALYVRVHASLWLCELEERHRKAFLRAVTNPDKDTMSLNIHSKPFVKIHKVMHLCFLIVFVALIY